MSLTIGPRVLIIGPAILALLVGGLIFAIGQDSKDVSTGQFSVSPDENTSILVRTYDLVGNDDPTWASCSAAALVDHQVVFCAFQVVNAKESSPIRYSVETLTVDTADGLGLADKLQTTFRLASGPADCNAGAPLSTPAALSSFPGFGDSTAGQQTGDRVLAAGAWENLCIEFQADFSAGIPFDGTTSGSFRVVADDEGLQSGGGGAVCPPGWFDRDGSSGNGCESSDIDGDGWYAGLDRFAAGFDCDDNASAVNPGATEIAANGIDDNCDWLIDPEVLTIVARNNLACPSGDNACLSRGSGEVHISEIDLYIDGGYLVLSIFPSCSQGPGEYVCSLEGPPNVPLSVTITPAAGSIFVWDSPSASASCLPGADENSQQCSFSTSSGVLAGEFMPIVPPG